MRDLIYNPVNAFALGLALASVMTFIVFAEMRRENRAWQKKHAASQLKLGEAVSSMQGWRHDCLNALDENDRLRADNARLNGHPSTRSDFDTRWSTALVEHTLDAHARLSPVGSVLPFPEQRRGEQS